MNFGGGVLLLAIAGVWVGALVFALSRGETWLLWLLGGLFAGALVLSASQR